ncbi:hypothetical protein PP175_06990 [Aneurinibacillus sp. Ricciae_BoGa-3]|uniref:hypothetical protein n=1 Tax=Aneurinibacillus sp. Ricciae_BoGa-3 TaxID=3022697 RepID=UPI002341182D|nr:hypothetical protein [Aneurinibacillus sp. Ricciae_BoGa-3]WCK55681.1 hypothetical protein PP175_06990 [Aneurinibacillus sp. Ricciae_BoGa-3]
MKQVRREAEKGETIIITNSMSPYFGKTFTVSYCVNGCIHVNTVLSFAHSEYEILEPDVDDTTRHLEIDYQLMVLHHAIQHGDREQIERSKHILSQLTR